VEKYFLFRDGRFFVVGVASIKFNISPKTKFI